MKKTLVALCTALSVFTAANAQTAAFRMERISELPRPAHAKGVTDDLTLGPDDNALTVSIAPDAGKSMEYFVSVYSETADRYLTPKSFTGSYENMVGPVNGKITFTGLEPNSAVTVYIASAVDTAPANVMITTHSLPASEGNGFTLSAAAVPFPRPLSFKADAGLNLEPDSVVTRGEMAKIVNNLLPEPVSKSGVIYAHGREFTDIGSDGFLVYRDAAETLINRRIAFGVAADVFDPDSPATIAQAVKLLLASMGYGPYAESLGAWPQGYMDCARELGLPVEKGADETALWSDVSKIVEAALYIPHMTVAEYSFLGGGVQMRQSPPLCYAQLLTNK